MHIVRGRVVLMLLINVCTGNPRVNFPDYIQCFEFHSLPWHSRLSDRKEIRPVRKPWPIIHKRFLLEQVEE